VDDDAAKRDRVSAALKDPAQKNNRDHVDIIIALGMAKEGFDWIWCEHALTVGYRSSLTEIVQIIGRATRDAPGKTRARFTNLIAEPDASEEARDRGRQRHAEGHRRQPAHGAGAGAALRVQAQEPVTNTAARRLRLWRGRL
jgi:superfamily II DNA or RNA helicase